MMRLRYSSLLILAWAMFAFFLSTVSGCATVKQRDNSILLLESAAGFVDALLLK